MPVGNQAALHQTLPHLPHARKIAAVGEARPAPQAQTPGDRRLETGIWGGRGHDARELKRG
jgi:hypothetical protein